MPHTVLVVEDEPAIADNVTYALETEGLRVLWCKLGEDALKALSGQTIHLVVLDVGLPDCNGFELCKTIRQTSSVPVLFLTARSDEVDRIVGLEIGGDDYMVKPFSPRELAARVKAILRRTIPAPPEIDSSGESRLSHGPFSLDKDRLQFTYFDQPLSLSRYEFRLLEVMLDRPGWVFTRNQLMERVWEEPSASMDRTVDSHIKTLRAKLKEIRPQLDPIQTHRGFGYSLKDTP